MDDFLKDMDDLFAMADKAPKAPPLDTSKVMRRLSGLTPTAAVPQIAPAFELPVRFLIGIGSVAAAMAIVVAAFAVSIWQNLNDPLAIARFLPDVLSFLKT